MKIFSINSRTSAQCKFYIRFMYYIRPLKETTTHLLMFPNKDTPCSWENEVIQERSYDMLDVVDKKRDCFLLCFVQNIRYLVGTSDVTTLFKVFSLSFQHISHTTGQTIPSNLLIPG